MPFEPAAPGTAAIDVWHWSLDVSAETLSRLVALLSEGEFARAARFVHERDRLRFVVGRGRLREILGRYLAVPPARVVFEYNAFGKPRLAGDGEPALHFNLSHSRGLALLAVSDRCQLGVDVEHLAPFKDDLARYFFSPVERRALRAVAAGDALAAFYRCWTRKEAFVKAHGAGLSLPLAAFDVSVGVEGEPQLLRLEGMPGAGAQWRLRDVAVPAGFVAALAVPSVGDAVAIRYREEDGALDDLRPELLARRAQPLNRASRM